MATIYVQSKVDLNCFVVEKVNHEDHGWEDRDQYHNIHKCVTQVIDRNEWRWRFETAKAILCAGYADTTGYYLGDVIGGKFV
jgi:hypothetical protein